MEPTNRSVHHRGYRSSIASALPYGAEITNSKELGKLIRSFGIERPVTKVFYPKWSLKIVLNYLIGHPFEPILQSSRENLTLKTVFLVALASGCRRSELCALSWDPQCFRFSPNLAQVHLLTEPGFLVKTQKTSRAPAKIIIKSLYRITNYVRSELSKPTKTTPKILQSDAADASSSSHSMTWTRILNRSTSPNGSST